MAIVYQHKRLDTNEIFYIGIGNSEKRAYNKNNNRNQFWKNIVNKTEYHIEILYENLTWEEACNIEINLIKHYGRRDLNLGTLVNLTDGGEGVIGNILSIEQRNKISTSNLGKIRSKESRKNISNGKKGMLFSEEHKKKLSISAIKRKRNFNDYKNIRKPIIQFNKENKIINEFISLSEASFKTGIQIGHISKVCKNIRKSAGGYIWKYK